MPQDIQITLDELYTIIGELEILRRLQTRQIQTLLKELEEVKKRGELGKSDSHE